MEKVHRVLITEGAAAIIDKIRSEHGPLMFHQSGGCCDGSQPMCFAQGDFIIGSNDLLIDTIYDCPFYMSADQFEYWQHTQLTVDVTSGRGSSFSLEIPLGLRFIVKSRVFKEHELPLLSEIIFSE